MGSGYCQESGVVIEVCCGSYEDALAAKEAGAHRVELNSALFLGGLTPSMGNFVLARSIEGIKLLPMVRPRPGGFFYSAAEYEAMTEDARLFVERGADGIVFGFLNADGTVNEERVARFVEIAGGKDAVFHRAFDLTPDPFAAMESLVRCGVTRILTSGQAPSAPEGLELIKKLAEAAKGRIEILPGAGIRATNVAHVVSCARVTQVHFSALAQKADTSAQRNPAIRFGGALYPREDVVDVVSVEKILGMVGALKG